MSLITSSNAVADSTNTATEKETAATETVQANATSQDAGKDVQANAEAVAVEAKATTDSTNGSKDEVKFDLKLAEGSLLSDKDVQDVIALAKEKGYTPEQAQLLLDRENATRLAYHDGLINQHKQNVEAWANQVKSDPELGGEKFKENVEHAHRALKTFASPKLIQLLDETGYGNHPELIRVFAKIGSQMRDDKLVMGGEPPTPKKSHLDLIYDNTQMKG